MEFVSYETARDVLKVMADAIPGSWYLTPMEQAAIRAALDEVARLRRERQGLVDSWRLAERGLNDFMARESWPGGHPNDLASIRTGSITDFVNAVLAGRNAATQAVFGT
jgi:hypothetical protein